MKITGSENNTVILTEIGLRIKDVRVSRSLTQKDLAEKAGISPKTVERIENGENVKIENLLNVLRIFDYISNINTLIPEQEYLTMGVAPKKRQRASKKISLNDENDWKWGDEA